LEDQTSIRLSKDTKSKLDRLKTHEKESYESLLKRQTENVTAAPDVDKDLEELERDKTAIQSKIMTVRAEIQELQNRRFSLGPDNSEFENISKQIREKTDQLADIQAYHLFLERRIEQAQAAEKQKLLQAERERKQKIIEWIRRNPPKCAHCLKSDKMRLGDWNPDTRLRMRQPVFPSNHDSGMTCRDVKWFFHYECTRRGCPSQNLGQRIYPDEPRTFADGSEDPDFPVRLEKDEEKTR